MIPKLSKVTIYVEDQQQAKHFWVDRMGYRVAYEQAAGPALNWLEVAAPDSRISFVLYPKAVMQAQNPEVPVGHPSVILCAHNLDRLHRKMKKNGIEVGKLEEFPYGRMFSFFDQDHNLYLVREGD